MRSWLLQLVRRIHDRRRAAKRSRAIKRRLDDLYSSEPSKMDPQFARAQAKMLSRRP